MATATPDIWISNEEGQRKLEGAELEAFIADREAILSDIQDREAQKEAKATAKAALLERLGITDDEAKLLLA
jgi:hypothetical protein